MSERRKSGIVWRRQTPATLTPLRPPAWTRILRSPDARRWVRRVHRALRSFGWTVSHHWPGAFTALVMGAVVGNFAFTLVASPWPIETTLRHIVAGPNCDAARAMGLAPANRDEPGYYSWHDADDDGVACEVWPPQRRFKRER